MKSIQIFFITLFIYYCAAHSWVACTNYQPTNSQNSIIYDNSRCAGFPRNWNTYNGNDNFGQDTGYNFQGEGCGSQNKRGSPVSAAYSTKYPMATWVAGQRTCIAWPSKNHVAAKTTNQYIPDNGLTLFRSAADQDADPSQATFKNNKIITFGPHVNGQIDYLGYQNCSNFDNNNDKALCLGCFQVPNLAAGLYTIQWYWIFNEGSAPYTTCFDVRVVSNGGQVTDPCSGIVCKNGGSCSNGACTCVGGYTGTFCDVAPGQTIPPSPTQAPGTLPGGDDSILDVQWPSTFGSNSFQVYMKYNAQGDRALVIDILKLPNYDFYGKGSVYVTKGQATATITITPQGTLNSGDSYVLKGWIVEKSTFDKDPSVAFTAELDKIIRSITYQSGATPTLPPTTTTGSVTSTTTTGASASTSSAALYSFNVIALFIILAAYFF